MKFRFAQTDCNRYFCAQKTPLIYNKNYAIIIAEGGNIMKEDKLGDFSMELSVDVLQLTKELRAKHENIISNQIGRSATSICANIAESKYAHSRSDFIAKLEISLKETNETGKWLEMLWKSGYIDEARYKALNRKCSTIRFLLIRSITTAKNNLNAEK